MFGKILEEARQLGFKDKRGKFHLPVDHSPAMKVHKGGSMCANCTFYESGIGKHGKCHEPNYKMYYGTDLIPMPANEYCSDWYKPE